MAIIGISGGKGGIGKSTIARLLLTEATRSGCASILADLDPQATALDWLRVRQARCARGLPPVDVRPFSTLEAALANAAGVDFLIVDSPARSTITTLELARRADLTVLPSGCSPDDLRPVVRLSQALVSGGVPLARLVVALNHVGTAGEEKDAREYLRDAGVHCLAAALPERAAYRQAHGAGRSAAEASALSLRQHAERLAEEIGDRIP